MIKVDQVWLDNLSVEYFIIFKYNDTFYNAKAPIEVQPSQPCYVAHRYDQDALTIISSFFFGHPTQKKDFLPAYSFTTHESYFFDIRRYDEIKIWS